MLLAEPWSTQPSTSGIINIVVIIVIIIVAGDLEMHPIIFAGGPMPQSGTISNSHPAFDMDNDSIDFGLIIGGLLAAMVVMPMGEGGEGLVIHTGRCWRAGKALEPAATTTCTLR
ncbi:hypothetical protein UVI_02002290 [Ustilaginoidea virens]|uniref:Uncharacterized protein n=1 Tax=Ustilaginoidea virens TaxID=1159556 RepID=A0A1B5L2N5_USTVR|nr:hypothetical protein UVI_02002290 [Ustilaginoidea virens]